MTTLKKLFVLDTNVLIHDPTAIYHFHEHDIFIPMVVLEELDHHKKGLSEIARNVRQTSRILNELLHDIDIHTLKEGICIKHISSSIKLTQACEGRLFFQTTALDAEIGLPLFANINDNQILNVTSALRKQYGERVILVSKDINLRIKATIIGIPAEDYLSDQVIDDADLLPTGLHTTEEDFWNQHSKDLQSWSETGRSFYRVSGQFPSHWQLNQALIMSDGNDYIIREIDETTSSIVIEPLKDYLNHPIWGIKARSREQNFALNLLMDRDIDFVSLLGSAGTGKTLLALAAGLYQTLDKSLYDEIIMTRITIPIGEDIGFLPGTEEEKMAPWMGALMDNLDVLTKTHGGTWGKQATQDLLNNRIKIRSLNFMRGRTLQNKFLIIDEAQNLTAKQMKTLITRAGENTKVVCLGNLAQIDTPFITENSSGLTYSIDHLKNWAHSGHVTLQKGERSRLSEFASEHL